MPLSIINLAQVVILPLLLLFLAGVLGYEFSRTMGLPKRPVNNEIVITLPLLSVFIGTTVLGFLLYLASLGGVLSTQAVWVLVAVQLAIAGWRRDFFSVVRAAFGAFVDSLAVSPRSAQIITLTALLAFGFFVFSGLSYAIIPTLDADSATTYLNAANLFLNYHSLIDVGNFVGNMGKTGFLQLVYGMGGFSAQVGHAWLFILSAAGMLLLFLLISQMVGYSIASLVLVALLTSNYVADSIVVPAKFDGLSFAWAVAALTLLVVIVNGERHRWAFVAIGAIAGFLAGISYNNIAVAGIVLLMMLGLLWKGPGSRWRDACIVSVAAAAAASPTYLQNVFLFGNPVYPFAGTLFSSGLGSTIPKDSFAYGYISEITKNFASSSLTDVVRLPLTLLGRDPFELQASHDPWLAAGFILAMAGGTWTGIRLATSERVRSGLNVPIQTFILAIGGFWAAYVFWAFTQHILRYFSAGLPFALLSCGIILSILLHSSQWAGKNFPKRVFTVMLFVIVSYMISQGYPQMSNRLHAAEEWIKEGRNENEYLAANFTYSVTYPSGPRLSNFGDVIARMRGELRPGDKVLSFITGNYYFGNNVRTFSGNGSSTLPSPNGIAKALSQFSDWREWEAHLRTQQFDYLVINPYYLYLSAREKPIVLGYLANRRPYLTIGDTFVFRIQ